MKKLVLIMAIVLVAGSAQAALVSVQLPTDGSMHEGIHNANQNNNQVYTAGDFFAMEYFDVSAYAGQTVTGDGTLTHWYFQAWNYSATPQLDAHQVNNNNADVVPSAMTWNSRGPGAWLDNGGAAMADLQRDTVPNLSTGLLGSVSVTDGTEDKAWDITIPQATIQAWLDGTMPSLLAVVDDSGRYSRWDLFTNGGDGSQAPRIQFDAVEGGGEPAVPEPAGLGLVGLALWAVRKRRS